MMYWNDVAKSMISGAYMDGQAVRHVMGDVDSVVNGLTLCPMRERFYWIDPRHAPLASTIQTARMDGTDRYA